MPRPRKYFDDAERRAAQDSRRKVQRKTRLTEFVGIDGEGTGKWKNHKYVLLGCGSSQIENPAGLQFPEIMEFLYSQYLAMPGVTFAGFFLGYDFNQWFKTLPRERAEILLTTEGQARRRRQKFPQLGPFPVTYEGWEFDILGMKRFKLRREGEKGWMYVCDSGAFFQASLMSVIDPRKWDEPIVTQAEYAKLEEGKNERDHAELGPGMRFYNALENDVFARLMRRVDMGLIQAGIHLKKNQWFGPGQAAQAWLSQVKAPTGESIRTSVTRNGTHDVHGSGEYLAVQGDNSPDVQESLRGITPLLDAGRMSYYGGWFEIMAHGHIPGNSWEYDINSAYPHIIDRLPCLEHGTWRWRGKDHGIHGFQNGNLALVHARIQGSDRRIGTMLHRCPDHSIRRPYQTGGWYWANELRAAQYAGLIDRIDVEESWTYDLCDCPSPLSGIAALYRQRLEVGKNSPAGKGLKLIYNSVYGKFAQSVGNPKYGNSFYASLITSGCRTMILEAIASHPRGTDDVVMVATDGIYFRTRHPVLEISQDLGSWEETSHSNLTLFKPGVYWDDSTRDRIRNGADPAFKARGISAKAFAGQLATVDAHFDGWGDTYPTERDPETSRDGWYPKVTFQSGFSMVTCLQALQRHKWYLAGAVSSQELTQDADPIGKRHSGYLENGVYWSRPFDDGGYEGESTPYDKLFGQPDAEAYGINDDGNVKDQWAKIFR